MHHLYLHLQLQLLNHVAVRGLTPQPSVLPAPIWQARGPSGGGKGGVDGMSTVAAVGQDAGVEGLTGLDVGALEISE